MDTAAAAEAASPGEAGDALVWERSKRPDEATLRLVRRVHVDRGDDAAIGILLDSPILVIGDGRRPDYGPRRTLRGHRASPSSQPCRLAHARRRHGTAFIATLLLADNDCTGRQAGDGNSPHHFPPSARAPWWPCSRASSACCRRGSQRRARRRARSVTTIPAIGNVGAAGYGSWTMSGASATRHQRDRSRRRRRGHAVRPGSDDRGVRGGCRRGRRVAHSRSTCSCNAQTRR